MRGRSNKYYKNNYYENNNYYDSNNYNNNYNDNFDYYNKRNYNNKDYYNNNSYNYNQGYRKNNFNNNYNYNDYNYYNDNNNRINNNYHNNNYNNNNYDNNYNKNYNNNYYNLNKNRINNYNYNNNYNNNHYNRYDNNQINNNINNNNYKKEKRKNKKENNKNNNKKNNNNNNGNKDKKKDEEIKAFYDSIKTKEIIFLKDLNYIIKMTENENSLWDFFNKEKIIIKLKEVFNINNYSEDELYKSLFELFDKEIEGFKKLNDIKQNKENKNEKSIKQIFDDVYNTLIILIQKNFIKKNESKEIKNKAINEFNNLVNKLPDSFLNRIDKYINIFNIEDELKEHFINIKNFEELSNKYNDNALLYILKLFKLQDKYDFTNFKLIPQKNKNFFQFIINLFIIYNKSKKMLINLSEYIKKYAQKYFDIYVINTIFKINKDNLEFDDSIKKFIYENLLDFNETYNNENIEEDDNEDEDKDGEYLEYCRFLVENNIEKFNSEYDILSFENIKSLINRKKYYKSAFFLIKNLPKEQLIKIDDNLLNQIIKDYFTFENKVEIKEFLELFPHKLNSIIDHFYNRNELTELLKILKYVKRLDELDDKIAEEIDRKRYYGILLNKFEKSYKQKKQYYSMIEFITSSEKYFNIFFPIFTRFVKKSTQDIDYKVIYTIINTALKKNFRVKKNILNSYNYTKKDLLNYNDFFGPHTKDCLSFTRDEINVIFLNNINDLKLYGEKYFKNSENEYIGFDSEWVGKINCKEKDETAILQLSDYAGKNILILDMINLPKDINFVNIFKDIFTKKKFIGFDIIDDLLNLPNDIMIHLKEKNELIDLRKLYRISTLEGNKSFSDICAEFFGKPLCKNEQCSNWEIRPLRESQLHYAALDAIYCCLLHKKIIENKNK